MHTCTNPNHKTLKDCYARFKSFDVPRGDGSILMKSLVEYNCDLVKLKVLIIRLRRGQIGGDWDLFQNYFEGNWKEYVELFDSRWLVSVLETYADFAPEPLCNNAMLAASCVTWERWSATLRMSSHALSPRAKPFKKGQMQIYDGLMTQQLSWADTPSNYFQRMSEVLASTPMILHIFRILIARMMNYSGSTLSLLDKSSDWDMKSSILSKINGN